MTPALIVTAISNILKNSSDLSYIDDNNILLGYRTNIVVFPCLLIEPIGDRIIAESYPNEQRILSLNITGYVQVFDKDKQIVGDTTTKGVVDIDNDIRKVISADITLGLEGVYDTQIVSIVHDFEQFPVRGFGMSIDIHYKQNRLTRA
jgi:hypothetical protein